MSQIIHKDQGQTGSIHQNWSAKRWCLNLTLTNEQTMKKKDHRLVSFVEKIANM